MFLYGGFRLSVLKNCINGTCFHINVTLFCICGAIEIHIKQIKIKNNFFLFIYFFVLRSVETFSITWLKNLNSNIDSATTSARENRKCEHTFLFGI